MDHIADANLTTLHHITRQHNLPEFVKTSNIDRDSVTGLPSSSFADQVKRRFPCHTRPDTFLSYAYFLKNAKAIHESERYRIYDSLRKWANHWAIFSECEALQREHEKQASEDLSRLDDSQFAIVEQWNGDKYRALPLLNSECIKAAANHLRQYRARYPLEWRQRAANRILKSAHDSGTELECSYITKAAGEHLSSNADIAKSLFDRVLFVNYEHRGEPEQIAMLKAARAVATIGKTALADKVASVVDAFDEHYNLKRFYERGLPSPEEIIHSSVSVKEAQEVRDQLITLTNGSAYTKASMLSAGIAPFRALGDDYVNAVSNGLDSLDIEKVAAVVPTLPRDDANLLDRALQAVGVCTVDSLRKKAGLSEDITSWTSDDWTKAVALVNS